jgi:hypothetical protein
MGFIRKDESDGGPVYDNHGCAAYGCPLPGSVSHGAGPGIKYYCRFHLNLSTEKFDAVTLRLNVNLPRVMELLRLQYDQQAHAPGCDKTMTGAERYFAAERELRTLLLDGIDQADRPPAPLTPTVKGWKAAAAYADSYQETPT